MKKIYGYVLRSYLGPLVLTFFIALFILLLQFLWKYIDDLVGKGLEFTVIARLMFYASATFVPLALPLAILLSSLMTFGNLGEHYELVAVKASGISIWKVMRPLVYLSVFISLLAYGFSNNVLPVANLKFQSLLYDVRQQKLAFNISEGVFYNGIENYIIRIGKKDKDGSTIYDVKIYDHSDRAGNIKVTTAKSGFMQLSPDQQHIIFTLFDGYNYNDIVSTRNYRDNRPFERVAFEQQRIKFDLSEFDLTRTDENLFKSHYTMLTTRQLTIFIDSLNDNFAERRNRFEDNFYRRYQNLSTIDTLDKPLTQRTRKPKMPLPEDDSLVSDSLEIVAEQQELKWPILDNFNSDEQFSIIENALTASRSNRNNIADNHKHLDVFAESIRKHEIAWHKKFSLSVACLILFFVGAPLGAIIRKGGLGLPVVMAVLLFVIYHIISITGEKMTKVGDIEAHIGVWLSSVALLPLGLFLTFKAATDAALLDSESWKKMFARMLKGVKRKAV